MRQLLGIAALFATLTLTDWRAEAQDKPKDTKVEVYIVPNQLPGAFGTPKGAERLKKAVGELVIKSDNPEGFLKEDTLTKITKVAGDVPKEGKVYRYYAEGKLGGNDFNSPTLITSPQKLAVGTKITKLMWKGEFKADETGNKQGSLVYFEAVLADK
jgi:hypothetical protein